MLPLKQKLIVPRSSLTTTTTASVSSVMPSAARWREPSDFVEDAAVGHREEHAGLGDAEIADDDRAVVQLVHALRHEERDEELALTARRARGPWHATNSSRFASCSKQMSAPMRWRASSVAAATTSSITLRLLLARHAAEERARAHAHEAAPDVVLEHDDDDEDDAREQRDQEVEQGDEPRTFATTYRRKMTPRPMPICIARVPRRTSSAR